jgi:O-acetyl-ADP-ribose deacetylase (regulator of RNase III)
MVDRHVPTLLLAGSDEALLHSWQMEFAAWSNAVKVVQASIEDVIAQVDALISPGNSYGQMDGGVDRAISRRFPDVQRAVWASIGDRYHGYQPVGAADVVATNDPSCPWLVYAPTMRVPMPLENGREIAVHDAFWAALLAIDAHNSRHPDAGAIRTVASPGFGTGYGRVNPQRAAELMATAYRFWRGPSSAAIAEREQLLLEY